MTISGSDLSLYCGALLILFATPGPVLLAVSARSLSGGFRAAWPLAIGVAVGDIIWPLVAVLGIAWILSVFDTFIIVLRWVACGVFILMGLA
jgi:threonine/homoserine/homoserine lactone efflux protein